ncbi:MAG: 2-phosphosulfolactate phosphatase [Oscillatoriales cyanobacterium C42_A2020_001]|nr:2-phosphosulfolactate phosphatase [Leptolyngbyaceae cyanobacterium C42_A2020_001]
MIFTQAEFNLRCEWGAAGITQLAPISDVVVIVDVLSFSTSVDIATRNGAIAFPYRWKDDSALAYAQSLQAELAGRDRAAGYSLSPASLLSIPAGTRLVLPSPNGSTLSLSTGQTPTLTGCFRNCRAIAQYAQTLGANIAVIPAGERWADGSLRPAWEDWVGAGAILSHLPGTRSPETEAAIAAFHQAKDQLATSLAHCGSGKELITRGFAADVELASQLNVSDCIPRLVNHAYINQSRDRV